jgi:hypothetical protein
MEPAPEGARVCGGPAYALPRPRVRQCVVTTLGSHTLCRQCAVTAQTADVVHSWPLGTRAFFLDTGLWPRVGV